MTNEITEQDILDITLTALDAVRADLVEGRAVVGEFQSYKTPGDLCVDWSIGVKLIKGPVLGCHEIKLGG